MNSVQLVGRFTKDPEVRYASNSGIAVVHFTLAVERKIARDEEQNADFIQCLAFNKTAEFIPKYFVKGQRIGLNGRIQTGSYTNQKGDKVYTTDVVVESCEFVEKKPDSTTATPASYMRAQSDIDGFAQIQDELNDDDLPFN